MRNRIYIILFHIAGALINLLLSLSLFENSIYKSLPFLEKFSDFFSDYSTFDVALSIVIVTVAILTLINTKYKKDKFLIPKYILTFLVSCQVSYMIFALFFGITWAIMIGIYGY